jgi:hypothetical protein
MLVAPVVLQVSTGLLQLSPNVMAGMVTAAVHSEASVSTAILAGQVTVGTSSSVTVTVKLQLVVLAGEAPSDTSTETVVIPLLKTAPFNVVFIVPVVAPDKVYTIDATVQLSEAVTFHAVPLWVYEHNPLFVAAVWLPGQNVIEGSSVSSIETSKLQLPVFPAPSVTVQVTVVVPG